MALEDTLTQCLELEQRSLVWEQMLGFTVVWLKCHRKQQLSFGAKIK